MSSSSPLGAFLLVDGDFCLVSVLVVMVEFESDSVDIELFATICSGKFWGVDLWLEDSSPVSLICKLLAGPKESSLPGSMRWNTEVRSHPGTRTSGVLRTSA